MTNQRYSPEFKDEAVRQIVDRGYSVAEVSKRLGVSAHSLLFIVHITLIETLSSGRFCLVSSDCRSEGIRSTRQSHDEIPKQCSSSSPSV